MASLFTLHKRPKTYPITDGESTLMVAMKPMTWEQTIDIADARNAIQKIVRDKYDTEERRAGLRAQYTGHDPDGLINQLIEFEKGTAISLADLAPGGDSEGGRTAAVDRWVERRREALKAVAPDQLVEILVDREVRQMVSVHANNDYMDLCLVRMIVDPETLRPLLSDNPSAEAYVRNLQARTRVELAKAWMDYMREINEPVVRSEAEAGPFVQPGDSPKHSGDSRGVETENSSTSPVTL